MNVGIIASSGAHSWSSRTFLAFGFLATREGEHAANDGRARTRLYSNASCLLEGMNELCANRFRDYPSFAHSLDEYDANLCNTPSVPQDQTHHVRPTGWCSLLYVLTKSQTEKTHLTKHNIFL